MSRTVTAVTCVSGGRELYCRMLSEFDYGPVVWTMTRYNEGMQKEEAFRLVKAFLQWVSLVPIVEASETYVMLKTPVEEAFHSFVLNTRAYEAFCSKFLGSFFHHDPLFEESAPQMNKAIEYTVRRLEQEYGDELEPALRDWRTLLNEGLARAACVGCKGGEA